jgi:MFS family permease
LFLTQILHAPVEIIGLIEGIAEGISSLMKYIFGYWSDRVGKRKIFVSGGYGLAAISKLLIWLASSWLLVLFARIIDRLGKGMRTSARDSLLLQNATAENKGFIFGFHRAMDSAGAVVGPLIALLFLQVFNDSIRQIFLIAFVPALIGFLLVVWLVKEKKHKTNIYAVRTPTQNPPFLSGIKFGLLKLFHTEKQGGMNSKLKLFFFVSIIFSLGNSSDTFLILRAQNLGLTTALIILTYVLYNVSQTIFSVPAGLIADKIGDRRVYAAGLIIFSFVYLAFGAIHNSFWIWFIFPVYGLYIAFTDSISKAYIAEFITEKVSGTYFGLYQTVISFATFFASFFAGILWTSFGASSTFYYGSFMAFAAFLLLLYGKISRPEDELTEI